jgi:hypothetical protein
MKHLPGPSACTVPHRPQKWRSSLAPFGMEECVILADRPPPCSGERGGVGLAFILLGGSSNDPSSGSPLVVSLPPSDSMSENAESFEAPDLEGDFDTVFRFAGVPST